MAPELKVVRTQPGEKLVSYHLSMVLWWEVVDLACGSLLGHDQASGCCSCTDGTLLGGVAYRSKEQALSEAML